MVDGIGGIGRRRGRVIGRRRSRVRVNRGSPEAEYRILGMGKIRSFNWLREVYEMVYS
jgi:hypothetical protein